MTPIAKKYHFAAHVIDILAYIIYVIEAFKILKKHVLFKCVAPSEKLHALILAESMMSILGEKWLIGRVKLPSVEDYLPADR